MCSEFKCFDKRNALGITPENEFDFLNALESSAVQGAAKVRSRQILKNQDRSATMARVAPLRAIGSGRNAKNIVVEFLGRPKGRKGSLRAVRARLRPAAPLRRRRSLLLPAY